jgi:hypothetical protein
VLQWNSQLTILAKILTFIATPHLFHTQGNVDLMLATIPTLGEAPSDTRSPSATHVRYFDISKAEVMMLLSALIYERDASKVKEAYQMYADDNDSELKEEGKEAREKKMHDLLWESEKRVRHIARRWGLHFAGVSELKSLGGPFCGKAKKNWTFCFEERFINMLM